MGKKNPVIKGFLSPFFEMGMNGIVWTVEEQRPLKQNESSYDLLNKLENGDRLTVYKNKARREILWQGEVSLVQKFQWVNGHAVDTVPTNIDPAKWDRMFTQQKPARLIKKVPGP